MDAFRTLDDARFDACLDDDVSLFNPDIPEATTLHLLHGQAAVGAYFHGMFSGIRAHSPEPRIPVEPRDVLIQLADHAASVVSRRRIGESADAMRARRASASRGS